MRTNLSIWIATACLLLLGSAASGQSLADPTGAAPLGIIAQSDARGPKLVGVLVAEFVDVGSGTIATSARVTVRLRRGSQLGTLFVEVAGPLDTEDTPDVQAALLTALELKVKKTFFADSCGDEGTLCPGAHVLLKQIDEFGLGDDGVSNQLIISDIVLAMSQSL